MANANVSINNYFCLKLTLNHHSLNSFVKNSENKIINTIQFVVIFKRLLVFQHLQSINS